MTNALIGENYVEKLVYGMTLSYKNKINLKNCIKLFIPKQYLLSGHASYYSIKINLFLNNTKIMKI